MSRRPSSRVASLVALASSLFALSALAAPAAVGADRYVALGDSFSSGVGTGSYTLSTSCRRGVYAYPWLVAQQRANTALTFSPAQGRGHPTCWRIRSGRSQRTRLSSP